MPAVIEINKKAIQKNIQLLKSKAPNSVLCAVLKSNAYGVGLEYVYKQLESVEVVAVAKTCEIAKVQQLMPEKGVVVLEGFISESEIFPNIQYYLHDLSQIEILEAMKPDFIVHVWIKINTGMNRIGFDIELSQYVLDRLKRICFVEVHGFSSHFSSADDNNFINVSKTQVKMLKECRIHDELKISIANSSGLLSLDYSHNEMVRCGISLYGVDPRYNCNEKKELINVLSLKGNIISIFYIKNNNYVGYGRTWCSPESGYIAVIDVGYADGYPRSASNNTFVYISGTKFPVVGNVSMDKLTVFVGKDKCVSVGEAVELWGDNISIESLALDSGRIPYEILTSIGSRPVRRLI